MATGKLGDYLKPDEGETSESRAASEAFVPGYTIQSLVEGSDQESRDTILDGDFTEPAASFDLKLSSLKALSDYAGYKLQENSSISSPAPSGYQDGTGINRDSPLKKSIVTGYMPDDNALVSLHVTKNASLAQVDPHSEENPPTISGFKPDEDFFKSVLLRDLEPSGMVGTMENGVAGNTVSQFGHKLDSNSTIQYSDSKLLSYHTMQNSVSINRFSPGSTTPFLLPAGDGKKGEERLSKGLFTLQQGSLGKYDAGRVGVKVGDLRKAALEILLKAQSIPSEKAAEAAAGIFSEGSSYAFADMLQLIAHPTQMGHSTIGIDGLRIRTASVMGAFDNDPGLKARGADDLLSLDSFTTSMGIGPGQTEGDSKDGKGKLATSIMGTSYGTMNSPSEPFGGVAPFGMVMPAFYSILIFGLAGLLIGGTISAIAGAGEGQTLKEPESPWTYSLGGNYNGAENSIGEKFLKMFGLTREVPLELFGMARGIMVYYGINFNPVFPGSVGAEIINSLINLLLGPGFYAVVAKRVLQDFTQITKAFENYTNINGVFTGITAVFASIEALMSSFTVRYFMIMNNLGKIVEDGISKPGEAAHGGNIVKLTQQEDYNVLTSDLRNKISRYHRTAEQAMSPMSAYLFNSLYLIPSELPALDTVNLVMQGRVSGLTNAPGTEGGGSRLSQEHVAMVEEKIDGEYMPFSIHDLRTNEVIGLPAFITNISDDFAANYSTTHGYGRTDPVHSYSKTTRSIQLGFDLVAMNKKDHHYIWFVVNKLITMLYPQRDQGQIKSNDKEGVTFVQPFSQRIAASPVVRIRVGDVIASNRSDSAMRKIFGGAKILSAENATTQEKINEHLAKWRLKATAGELAGMRSGLTAAYAEFQAALQAGIPEVVEKAGELYMRPGTKLYAVDPQNPNSARGYEIKLSYPVKIKLDGIKKFDKSPKAKPMADDAPGTVSYGTWKIKIDIADEVEAYALGGTQLLTIFRKSQELGIPSIPPFPPAGPEVSFFLPFSMGPNVQPVDHYGLASNLGITGDSIKQHHINVNDPVGSAGISTGPASDALKAKVEAEGDALKAGFEGWQSARERVFGDTSSIAEFLSPERNAIIRSFDSTAGRGLAGVITNLSLDYYDALWGTSQEEGMIDDKLRAPKNIRISLNFNPIHDMPLGLDSNGEMFAPSHPVGKLVNTEITADVRTIKFEHKKSEAIAKVTSLPDTTDPGRPKLPF